MLEPDFDQTLLFFKALANDTRLRIVGLLAERARSVQELSVLLGVKEPTVSHHLTLLGQIDLLNMRTEGNTHWYTLRKDQVRKLGKGIFSKPNIVTDTKSDDRLWHERILQNFIEQERIKQIPASRKKRWIVLRWLVEKFDCDKQYTEAAVNDLIQRHHWDSATLRRELIGYKMLTRRNGTYWRLPEADWQEV